MQGNHWSLQNLFMGLVTLQEDFSSISISGLSIDSRSTNAGDLFFALKGITQHGLKYCQQAIDRGAVAIAWESSDEISNYDLPNSVPCVEVPALQNKLGFISHRFYDDVTKDMHVVGVTGTDGKTSVSQFIAQAMQQREISCGVIGTLGYGIYPDLNEASHTTPDAIRVHTLLHQYHDENVKHAVIEASSHGLVQGRLNGVQFDTAVFTNLGRDHMDYHASIEEYGNAKKILFQSENLKNAIINIDDAFGKKLANDFSDQLNVITYSIQNDANQSDADLKALNIDYREDKTCFDINSSWGSAHVCTTLTGDFNVSNVLATLGVLIANNEKFHNAVKAVESVRTVPGRMEFIKQSSQAKRNTPAVVIDYAHTPQALENVLRVLQAQCEGKLYCVFGCGGDRDAGKRALMARAVERFADEAIVTDDNPRFEDPDAICDEVKSGFSTSYPYVLIHDRQKAIRHAIEKANTQDLILIAGKGHEVVQIIKDKKLPFDDKKIAQQVLQGV